MGKTVKWILGICAFGGLIIVIVLFTLFWQVKDTIFELRNLQDAREELIALHGEVVDFVPPPSGVMAAKRLDAFLAVRDALAENRASLLAELDDFPPEEVTDGEVESFGAVMKVLEGLGELLVPIIRFLHERDRALLDSGMGLGEYLYIYSLAYFSWLEHSPGDGPVYVDESGRRERILDGEDSTFGREEVWQRYHEAMLAIIGNQLAEQLREDAASAESMAWREILRGEYLRLKRDARHVPWRGELPPAIAASLEPYRERLAGSWSAALNCFELSPMREEDWRGQGD